MAAGAERALSSPVTGSVSGPVTASRSGPVAASRSGPVVGSASLADPDRLRVAICQINPTVGDLDRNVDLVTGALAEAGAAGADVAVLPELAVTGYPPEDLVLRPGFVAASRAALERVAAATGPCAAVVGFVDGTGESRRTVPDMAGVQHFSDAYNAVAVCANGEVCGVYRKRHLPNYDVFDEMRHFRAGLEEPPLFEIGGAVVGVTVCEDAWVPDGPVSDLARAGAQLVVNVNGSPFRVGKQAAREQVIGRRAAESGVAVVCVNLVGGQDELVFDGGSFVIGADGSVVARCVSFSETVEVFDVDLPARKPAVTTRHPAGKPVPAAPRPAGVSDVTAAAPRPAGITHVTPGAVPRPAGKPAPAAPRPVGVSDVTPGAVPRPAGEPVPAVPRPAGVSDVTAGAVSRPAGIIHVTPAVPPDPGRGPMAAPRVAPTDQHAQRWAALTLATRDYVHKSGFSDVCVGLSGGVDSSLTATVAADALGADHVHGVLMPSRHSSEHSVTDAEKLAANLGIDALIVGIEPGHAALAEMIEAGLGGGLDTGGITDQNLQSRIRGVTLMALANERGWLVLTTGNKSELAVGYSTLYGDTAGAFAVVSDLWKLDVYELCRWRNERAGGEVIPSTVLAKAPSAELAPGQRDDQSLPPYEILDPILRLYVEDLHTAAEIQAMAVAPPEVVERVCSLVDSAEYKRRQTPIGPRLTGRAFGRDRRMPIINRYR